MTPPSVVFVDVDSAVCPRSADLMLQISPKEKVTHHQDKRMWGPGLIPTLAHHSSGKLPSKVLQCGITGVCRSTVLLRPHHLSAYVMLRQISLYNMIFDSPQVLSCIEISLHEMGTKDNSCSCEINPNHELASILTEFYVMARWMPVSKLCILSHTPGIDFLIQTENCLMRNNQLSQKVGILHDGVNKAPTKKARR